MALDHRLQQNIAHLDLTSNLSIDGTFVGGGAYGDVVKGHCMDGSRGVVPVAVKRLRTLRKDDWHIIEKEIYVWSKLKHENILGLLGYCVDNATGTPMLVSEWMENGTAWEYMKLHPDADVLRLVTGIARGLEYLHESDVVHSDIKSDNVLVSVSGDARICDFGCSRMISASLNIANLSQTPKGTLRYLAYELLKEQTGYTVQTDVWAFGMTVFELVTLRRPYATLTDAQAISAIQRRELPSFSTTCPRNLHRRCLDLLRHICQSCWRFQASNRPAMPDVVKSLNWQMERREKTATYVLRVVRLEDGQVASHRPCVSVELKVNDEVLTSRTIKVTDLPVWNETFVFTASEATVIEIRVKQRSQHSNIDQYIGEAKVKLRDLMEKCACGEAQLELSVPSHGATYPMSDVYVYLKGIDAERRVSMDIEKARRDIQDISPSPTAIRLLAQQVEHIVEAINVVAINVEPYINLAWHAASALHKVVSRFANVDERIVDMVHAMGQALEFARVPRTLADRSSNLREVVDEVLKQTLECFRFVERNVDQCDRAVEANYDEPVAKYKLRFLDLKESLDTGIAPSAAATDGDDGLRYELEWLEKQLCPVKTDISSRPRCLHSTRRFYLDQIMAWLFSDTNQNVFCLTGIAGSGKSTIAATIVDYCNDRSRLAAHLFFERGRTNQGSIVRTIAYMLAEFNPSIAQQIIAAVRDNRNILDAPATKQFERLVLGPLKAAERFIQEPMIVVLDALDECGTIPERREVMRLLKAEFPKLLPFKVRFLVTSRPEDDIVKAISQQQRIFSLALDHASAESRSDIHTYLDHDMHAAIPKPIPDDLELDAKVNLLADAAKGLFVWASTAVNMVSTSDDPVEKLGQLLSNSQSLHELGLYGLYAMALRQSGISWHDAMSKQRTVRVLGLVLLTKEALSDTVLDKVLGLGEGKSRLTLQRLRSVVYYEPGKPVYLHHASFADYITSFEHSGDSEWFVGINDHKRSITSRCFAIMENLLRFNICDIGSSFVSNEDDADIQHRIEDKIPPHLSYACRFWSEHACEVSRSGEVNTLIDQLNRFAYEQLLYWFEVLSLTGYFTRIASLSLYNTFVWTSSDDSELSSFLWDAYKLASSFALPILQSVPHIYLSALSLRKGESVVSDHYSSTHPTIPVRFVGTKPRDPCIKILKGHTTRITSVAVSSDGRHVVSGDEGGTVRTWEAESGELIVDPLENAGWIASVALLPGERRAAAVYRDCSVLTWSTESGELVHDPFRYHSGGGRSAVFSPNGKCVATGFHDGSIQIWDIQNGSVILGPLKEHMRGISAVAYSPNGNFIASGSADDSIRIWDAQSGNVIYEPLLGHSDGVWAVAISPDGNYIASGAGDCAIRIWKLDSGKVTLGPLKGHGDTVTSVAYSPDGKLLASASRDRTIRVWGSATGELVFGPLLGHTLSVETIAFFPDGKRLLSGSNDQTVRIWEIESNTVSPETLECHKGWINSLAFSPDGRYLASGADDASIYIWDMRSGRIRSGPFRGHTKQVTCITYSPDGKLVASASYDGSVRIWNAASGEIVSVLEEHTDWATSVSFSPDGKQLASGSYDKTIIVWNAESGEVALGPLQAHTRGIRSVVFSPDGSRIVSGSEDYSIRVWNTSNGEVVFGPLEGHTSLVRSVALSPDGRYVASGSWDKTIRIWNMQTGELVFGLFEGHTDGVMSVAFSMDGNCLASGSADCTIRIWDVRSGRIISDPLIGHTDYVNSIAFSPCGRYIVSCSSDSTIQVWKMVSDWAAEGNSIMKWQLSDDGWIRGCQGELLTWIPEDMRGTLLTHQHAAIFNHFSTELKLADSPIGKGWCKGYPLSRSETKDSLSMPQENTMEHAMPLRRRRSLSLENPLSKRRRVQ